MPQTHFDAFTAIKTHPVTTNSQHFWGRAWTN